MLTDYTTYDQIRAVLSVTDEELEDGQLELPIYTSNLYEQFSDLGAAINVKYLELMTAGAPWSADERRFLNVAQVFSTYAVAIQLLDALPLLAVQSEQDARAQYTKFAGPFERVEPAVRAAFAMAKTKLVEVYNVIATTVLTGPSYARRYTGKAGLAVDPVTGA